MRSQSRGSTSVILVVLWLLVVALVSGRIAYSQSCYSSGDTRWITTHCDGFDDNECSAFSQYAECAEYYCDTPGCGFGYYRECEDIDNLCGGPGCGGEICAAPSR